MLVTLLKTKIHGITVTMTDADYRNQAVQAIDQPTVT